MQSLVSLAMLLVTGGGTGCAAVEHHCWLRHVLGGLLRPHLVTLPACAGDGAKHGRQPRLEGLCHLICLGARVWRALGQPASSGEPGDCGWQVGSCSDCVTVHLNQKLLHLQVHCDAKTAFLDRCPMPAAASEVQCQMTDSVNWFQHCDPLFHK